jgi:hypothetical protein
MIPREILKQNRKTGIFTNQLVKISSSVFPLRRLAAGVKNGQNHDALSFNEKMDHKGKTLKDHCSTDFAANFGEPFRVVGDALKRVFNDNAKLSPQSLALVFIVSDGIIKFLRGHPAKDQAVLHLRYFMSSLALTSSSGRTSSGWLRCSCKRWSMNSASPGVNSFDSTMPSQRLRHSSICSASGRARASFKTNSELITLNLTGIKYFASA